MQWAKLVSPWSSSVPLSSTQQPKHFSPPFLLLKCLKPFTGSRSHHSYSRTKSIFLCNFYEALGPPQPTSAASASQFLLVPGICLKCFPMASWACARKPSHPLGLANFSSLARPGKMSSGQHSLTSLLSPHQAPNI